MKSSRQRLDTLLVARGQAASRERARALIMSGNVLVNGMRVDKPGTSVAEDASIDVKGPDHPWVSRGGLKLQHALSSFELSAQDAVALDVGASTGGFTDVLLQSGAAKVYAVDVGHGQLDWKLRQDPRVVVLERTNARHLSRDVVADSIDIVVCDASFIGLRTVLPAALDLVGSSGLLVALIKPQFEAGREHVGKGGVVRDPQIHEAVCAMIHDWIEGLGWHVLGIEESPVRGPAGNREFLIAARRG